MAVHTYVGNKRFGDMTARLVVRDIAGDDRLVGIGQAVDIAAGVQAELELGYILQAGGSNMAPLASAGAQERRIAPVYYDLDADSLSVPRAEARLDAVERGSVRLSDYITGAESAAVQQAGMQAAVDDAVDAKRELWFDIDAMSSGATELLQTAPLEVDGKLRALGRGVRLRQTVAYQHAFDQHEDAEGSEFDDFELIAPARVYPLSGAYRTDNPLTPQTAIYATAHGTRLTRIRGGGWLALIYLVNWKHELAAKSGYVDGCYTDDIESYADNDFGILATGQEGAHIGTIRGSYSPSLDGTSPPPHLVYFTDNQPSKRITGGGWRAVSGSGIAGHAYSIKGITGGSLSDLVAQACPGLLTLSTCHRLVLGGLSSVDDASAAADATLQFGTNDSTFVQIADAVLHGTPAHRFVALNGSDNSIGRLVIATTRNAFDAANPHEVSLAGLRNTIERLEYDNASATESKRLIRGDSAGGGGHRCHVAKARNIRDLATISSGSVSTIVTADPAQITPGTNATSQLSTLSEATARLEVNDFRREAIMSNGLRQDPSKASTHVLRVQAGTAMAVGIPYGGAHVGREVTWEVWNDTAGALSFTWNAVFVFVGGAAPANPAAGKRIRVSFMFDGTNWLETRRAALP